ncbi:hypothetical protein FRC17_010427 [Serendipita sp. 399]|nr:hypothetical protein FRC17_010427 [Serendipita sp. 399]
MADLSRGESLNPNGADPFDIPLQPSPNLAPQQQLIVPLPQDQDLHHHYNVGVDFLQNMGTTIGTDAPPPAYSGPAMSRVNVPVGNKQRLTLTCHSPLTNAMTESESVVTIPMSVNDTATSSGTDRAPIPDMVDLPQWARDNRGYITEKLEAKLDAAGYVPTDNPDSLSPDVWKREWGVTELELRRMRALYARTQA